MTGRVAATGSRDRRVRGTRGKTRGTIKVTFLCCLGRVTADLSAEEREEVQGRAIALRKGEGKNAMKTKTPIAEAKDNHQVVWRGKEGREGEEEKQK